MHGDRFITGGIGLKGALIIGMWYPATGHKKHEDQQAKQERGSHSVRLKAVSFDVLLTNGLKYSLQLLV
jgi:hypothetical protein